jgi:hypothetical protein
MGDALLGTDELAPVGDAPNCAQAPVDLRLEKESIAGKGVDTLA